ncbi:hypothetical protein LCGC14_1676560, partial [marine sediment metagenome]
KIYKNGADWSSANWDGNNRINQSKAVSGSDVVFLDATDYIEIFVYHNHGSNIDFNSGTNLNFASITRI